MRVTTTVAPSVLVVVAVMSACGASDPGEDAAPLDGQTVFRELNCALCHTAAPAAEHGAEADSLDRDDGSKLSDLSGVGTSWSAEQLRLFLIDGGEVDGRGHVTLFTGTEDEWLAMSDWLLGLWSAPDSLDGADRPAAGTEPPDTLDAAPRGSGTGSPDTLRAGGAETADDLTGGMGE